MSALSEKHQTVRPLYEWLEKVGAKYLWHEDVDKGRRIYGYMVNGNTLLVQIFLVKGEEAGGWDVYTALNSLAIDASLADAEKRLTEVWSPSPTKIVRPRKAAAK